MTFEEWFKTVEVEVFDNFDNRMYQWDLKNWMRDAWETSEKAKYDSIILKIADDHFPTKDDAK